MSAFTAKIALRSTFLATILVWLAILAAPRAVRAQEGAQPAGLSSPAASSAASPTPSDRPVVGTPTPVEVGVAYYGHLVAHPGAQLEAEAALVDRAVHRVLVSGAIGGYHQPFNHTGLFALAEIGYRATAAFGLFAELRLGTGLHHALAAGPTYREVAGVIQRVPDPGQSTLLLGAAIGVGWDFSRLSFAPFRVFVRAAFHGQFPINWSWVPGGALIAGVAFRIPWRP